MRVVRSNQHHEGFKELVTLLDAELAIRDGDDHAFYHQFNGVDHLDHVVLCLEKGKAVACGAFKIRMKKQVEIKRMYVMPSHRRRGFAEKVLGALEKWAKDLGVQEVILETGKAQVEALSFYPKMGYEIIAHFPPYVGVDNSICFGKNLID